MTTSSISPVRSTPTTASGAPIRIALAAPSGRLAYRRLKARLETCKDRVQLVGRGVPSRAELVLLDPCAGGRPLDLAALGETEAGGKQVVVYTSAPAIDPLAFAMTGSLMDGRLRGWLSDELGADELVAALERIVRGEIVVSPAA